MKSRKTAFEEDISADMSHLGISYDSAIQRVQGVYNDFNARNDRLIERQNDATNLASGNYNNQITLTATAILTFSGAYVGVIYNNLTNCQYLIFIIVALSELAAIACVLLDYRITVNFHENWATTYQNIYKEVREKVDNRDIQSVSELGKVEQQHVNKMEERTTKKFMNLSLVFLGVGAVLFMILLFGRIPHTT